MGHLVTAWKAPLNVEGSERVVEYVQIGRIAYMALSTDKKNAWLWDQNNKQWKKLGDEYLRPIAQTIRIARQQSTPELVKLPIFAAE